MDYKTFCVQVVDYTNGIVLGAAPPRIDWHLIGGDRPRLEIKTAFAVLPGRVMDRDNFHIFSVDAAVLDRCGRITARESTDGKWLVGESAALNVPIVEDLEGAALQVTVGIAAARPYPFRDYVASALNLGAATQLQSGLHRQSA